MNNPLARHAPALCMIVALMAAPAHAQTADLQPLSPAQTALFDTPHLANVTTPETLRYDYTRVGPDNFSDTITIHIRKINENGSKDLSFDYLTGAHHVAFPQIDDFRANPLLMLVLERDVSNMGDALSLSKAYLRNRIVAAFRDAAAINTGSVPYQGSPAPSRTITITPFAPEERLALLPAIRAKTYTFVLADGVPGMIDAIHIDTPADPKLDTPPLSEQITFAGTSP